MNFDCCIICGDGFKSAYRVSPDNIHFYHSECYNDPESSYFIKSCLSCRWDYLSKSTNQKNCILCGNKNNDNKDFCIKQINLCKDCSTSLFMNYNESHCPICLQSHCFRKTSCKECSRYIEENNENSDSFFYYCRDCIVKQNCEFCHQHLNERDFTCCSGHSYHVVCFKKKPLNMRECKDCLENFSNLLSKFINSNNTGYYCTGCKTYFNDKEVSCLFETFYCDVCINQFDFLSTQIECFCDSCEDIKKFIEDQKKKLILCSSCNNHNFKDFVSTCNKVKICVNCARIPKKPGIIFEKLRGCNCSKCILDQTNYLKGCSICLIMEFDTRTTNCEFDNFYCENCINERFFEILDHCSCSFCVSIQFSCLIYRNIPPECRKCKTLLNLNQKCDIFKFYCENCWENNELKITCTCGLHPFEMEGSILIDLKSRFRPICVNCKRQSEFAVDCNHNQCFLCALKKIVPKFFKFLENYKNKNFRRIEKKFSFECSQSGCNFKFDFSGVLCLEKLIIFSDWEKNILSWFLPYFDGIEFEFKICNCSNIVGVNGDVFLGCSCN